MRLASELSSLFMTSQVNVIHGQSGSIQGESERESAVEGSFKETFTAYKQRYLRVHS